MQEKRPARFVFVGPAHPYRGGIAHFMDHLAEGLNERGAETHVVTFTRQYPEFLFPGRSQFSESVEEHRLPSTRMLDSVNPLSWRRTAKFVEKLQPDVVVFKYWMSFFAPAFGRVARSVRAAGAQVVVVVDNALPHERRPGDVALARYFFRQVDGVIAMSRKVKEDLEDVVGVTAPLFLIPHPVYDNFGSAVERTEARSDIGIDPDIPVLLFFGFIRKYKGLDVLIDALPDVVRALPKVQLVVAGEFYDDEQPYREQVRNLGMESVVQFRSEYIPDDAVGSYFSACDLVVQPYRSATQSGVAQIAFHFDRPVIVTDVGGLSEIVPDGRVGFVVPPEDPGSLAHAIIRYFNENLADSMTDAVRIEKLKYRWDDMYEAIESFIGGNEGD